MQEETIFGLAGMGFSILFITLLVVVFIALTKIKRTRIQTDHDEQYKRLALDAVESQKETVQLNKQMAAELEEVKERLSSIEKMLKEVE